MALLRIECRRIEISVFEQEIQDFPGVCKEKKKGDAESVEKTRILEITTLSLDYSPQCCPPTPRIIAFQSSDLSEDGHRKIRILIRSYLDLGVSAGNQRFSWLLRGKAIVL
jgi:hypothetical protein